MYIVEHFIPSFTSEGEYIELNHYVTIGIDSTFMLFFFFFYVVIIRE